MQFGVQLYNFRDYLAKDFKGVLNEIAKIGFDGVEFFSAYHDHSPEDVVAMLKESGLQCCGTMFGIDALKDIDYDGLVLTTPFYQMEGFKSLVNFFTEIADYSDKPVYLYDLPGVTKIKITFELVKELAKHPNIKGIKSGDIVLGRLVKLNLPKFNFFFSNLDIFDVSISYGIEKVLDGMFTCMPKTSKALTLAIEKGDKEEITKNVSTIIAFRDQFLKNGIWPGYTIAMNLLGLDGIYGQGYKKHEPLATEYEEVKEFMKKIGEI